MKAKILILFFLTIFLPKISASDIPQKTDIILSKIEKNKINFIQLEFTDIFGNPKSFTITSQAAKKILNDGAYFDGSSVLGYVAVSRSDLLLVPDLSTFNILPWTYKDKKTARLICDVHQSNGIPFDNCPRIILKKIEHQAKEMGYFLNVAPELEFFLIKETDNSLDKLKYCDLGTLDQTSCMKMEILNTLYKMGIKPEKTHHEVASSQHEITMHYGPMLQIADNLITMKTVIEFIATKYGYKALFMPKPFFGTNGSGMHIHYSLFDINKNKNLFYDPADPCFLSSIAKNFIAGNLKYIQEITAIFNPTINSYKRLVAGYEAPVYIAWGRKNRSTLIRIPDMKPTDANAARAEIRSPDPMANPYLAFAALLKSGLEGIKEKQQLSKEINYNLFKLTVDEIKKLKIKALPGSLKSAIKKLGKSNFAKELLGEKLHKCFVETKRKEAQDFAMAVTDWEIQKYG